MDWLAGSQIRCSDALVCDNAGRGCFWLPKLTDFVQTLQYIGRKLAFPIGRRIQDQIAVKPVEWNQPFIEWR